MPRNLYERCEVVYPVCTAGAADRLRREILETYLHDDVKGRVLGSDGLYRRKNAADSTLVSAQEWFLQLSRKEPLRSAPLQSSEEPKARPDAPDAEPALAALRVISNES